MYFRVPPQRREMPAAPAEMTTGQWNDWTGNAFECAIHGKDGPCGNVLDYADLAFFLAGDRVLPHGRYADDPHRLENALMAARIAYERLHYAKDCLEDLMTQLGADPDDFDTMAGSNPMIEFGSPVDDPSAGLAPACPPPALEPPRRGRQARLLW